MIFLIVFILHACIYICIYNTHTIPFFMQSVAIPTTWWSFFRLIINLYVLFLLWSVLLRVIPSATSVILHNNRLLPASLNLFFVFFLLIIICSARIRHSPVDRVRHLFRRLASRTGNSWNSSTSSITTEVRIPATESLASLAQSS